jgi:hypothetical protein
VVCADPEYFRDRSAIIMSNRCSLKIRARATGQARSVNYRSAPACSKNSNFYSGMTLLVSS